MIYALHRVQDEDTVHGALSLLPPEGHIWFPPQKNKTKQETFKMYRCILWENFHGMNRKLQLLKNAATQVFFGGEGVVVTHARWFDSVLAAHSILGPIQGTGIDL